jgi:hypothetical protein
MLKITRTSILSGKTRTLYIDITQAQMDLWQGGILIQQAMPNITDDEREFIMTGIVDEEWNTLKSDV